MKRLESYLIVFLLFAISACHSDFSPLDSEIYGPVAGQYIRFEMEGQTHTIRDVIAQKSGPPGSLPLGTIRGEFLVRDTTAYLDINISIPNDTMVQVQQVMLRLGREDNSAQYYRGGVSHNLKLLPNSVIEGSFTGIVRGLAGTSTEGIQKQLKNGFLSVKYIQR